MKGRSRQTNNKNWFLQQNPDVYFSFGVKAELNWPQKQKADTSQVLNEDGLVNSSDSENNDTPQESFLDLRVHKSGGVQLEWQLIQGVQVGPDILHFQQTGLQNTL